MVTPRIRIEQVSPRSYWLTAHYQDSEQWWRGTMERHVVHVWAPIPKLARLWAEWKSQRMLASRMKSIKITWKEVG